MNLGRSGHGPLLMLIHSATNSSALSDTQRRLFYDNEARRLQYQKMCREDPDYTDMIYYYLVENGTDLHRSMTSEEFHDHIQKQYDNVMDGVY